MSHDPTEDSLQNEQIRSNGHPYSKWDFLLHILVGILADALAFRSRQHFQSFRDFHLVIQCVVAFATQSKAMDLCANLVPGTVGRGSDRMLSEKVYFLDWRQT